MTQKLNDTTERNTAYKKVLPKAGLTEYYRADGSKPTFVILLNGSAETPRLRQYPNRLNYTQKTLSCFPITRVYSESNGESHFEDIEIPLKEAGSVGKLSEVLSSEWCCVSGS